MGGGTFAPACQLGNGNILLTPPPVAPPPCDWAFHTVSAEMLEPLMQSSDAEDVVCAGYLLCLLGKKEGLPPLLASWEVQKNDRWNKTTELLYRAIATLDDDSQTPVLEQIYKRFGKNNYYIRGFYWTIRVMHGPNILKLRKTIRDEIGMPQLE